VKIRTCLLVIAAAMAVVACGEAPEASTTAPVTEWENVSSGKIQADDPIPTPEDEPILEISGLVSNTNQSDAITIDLATLEQMPLVKLKVFEPFEEKDVTFEGVLMSDLMTIAGADRKASEAHFTALDDYEIDIPLEEITSTDVLLATKADGEHMSIEDGGPTRIVFPPDSEFGENTDAWIWNVETIVIR
jgi:hypothetical protein